MKGTKLTGIPASISNIIHCLFSGKGENGGTAVSQYCQRTLEVVVFLPDAEDGNKEGLCEKHFG